MPTKKKHTPYRKNKFLLIFTFLLSIVWSYGQQCGTLMKPLSLEERANEATRIIEGEVISSQSYWDANRHNIYTVHTISVYKKMLGDNTVTIKIVTTGGKVDDEMQVTSSAAHLNVGVTGVFFLKAFTGTIRNAGTLYKMVGAAQGLIKYDKHTNKGSDVFYSYNSIQEDILDSINNITGRGIETIQNRPVILNANRAILATPSISNFSPTSASAGTQTILTINGSNFGSTMGEVSFSNADDGGNSYVAAFDSEIISWSDTQIQVEIPYAAGTGDFRVTNNTAETGTSSSNLTIIYNHQAASDGTTHYPSILQDDDGNGGYTFQYHTDFNSSSAKTYFEDAFDLWNCESDINFTFGSTTTTDESINDGINIVRFDNGSELASGVLGQVTTRFLGTCGSTGKAIVSELDITWNDDINWYYGSGNPGASQYDFKSVALHELGHTHQLGHVIDTNVIMHYAIGSGDSSYALNQNDIDGAVYTMDLFTQTAGCGITAMSTQVNCCDAAAVTTDPSNDEVCELEDATFTSAGTDYDSVQWQVNDGSWSDISNGSIYAGVTTTTLTISDATYALDGNLYRLSYTNACGDSTNSSSATLTVNEYVVATVAVQDETCTQANGEITFSFDANSNRTNLEFSVDGGSTYPYNYDDTDGSATETGFGAATYNIWVRWGDNDCPIELGDYIINNQCTYTIIPDSNFEAALEALGYDDISSDGQVPTSLIETITTLDIDGENISNLTGIEDFTALEELNADNNALTSVDFIDLVNLKIIYLSDNSLLSIDVTDNISLETLHFRDNSVSTLDLSNNGNLKSLAFQYNSITSIDLSNNTLLTGIACRNNGLTSLDLTNNTALINVYAQRNDITDVDLSNNPDLEIAAYAHNELTYFDIRNGNNTNITTFNISNNSNLSCALVDDAAYSTTNWTNIDGTTSFSESYCRYTTISDSNFEAALEALGYDDISSDGQVPTALIEVVTNLDVSDESISNLSGIEGFTALVDLNVQDNNLSVLNLSSNLLLEDLNCSSNNFFYLDLSSNLLLNSLYADNGWLLELDVSANTQLQYLYLVNNNLTSLNYKNGNNTNVLFFNTTGNSNLTCILVDDAAYSATNWTSIDAESSFSDSYCRYTNIPDANFEAALEILGYDDISSDGQVPTALIEALTILDISNKNIADLTGIEDFAALDALDCSNNQLNEVDFSSNTLLTYLDISSNNLPVLNVPTSIVNLVANSNNLVFMDLTSHTALEELSVNSNELVYLNLQNGTNTNIYNLITTNNIDLNCIIVDDIAYSTTNWTNIDNTTNFSTSYCRYTQIPDANFETRLENLGLDDISGDGQVPTALIIDQESLDISFGSSGAIYDVTGIEDFYSLLNLILNDNLMTSVNLSSNANLGLLTANNTALTSVDLSANTELYFVSLNDCDDLSSLNLQNGNNTKLISDSSFQASNVPNLSCVLVDDESYASTTWVNFIDSQIVFNETVCTTDYALSLKVFLQGALIDPNTGEENLMRDDLRVADLLPTTSTYTDLITCESSVFTVTGDDAIVDWIWVELRDATDNTIVSHARSALLQRDGDIVDVDGVSVLNFATIDDSYYIAINHRNHLGIMSSTAITFNKVSTTIIDFTDATNEITYGSNAQTTFGMPTDIVAMWTGNANEDTIVQYSGTDPDTPDILSTVLNDAGNFLNFPTYVVSGYDANDVNMDGNTQYSGTEPDVPFILQNILAHPSNFLNFSTYQITEQLPENE